MSNDELFLKDGTKIELMSSLGVSKLSTNAETKEAALDMWEKLTKENLSYVVIRDSSGEVVDTYNDLILEYFEGRENTDGTVLVTFSLRSKTTEEALAERIKRLEDEDTSIQMALVEVYEMALNEV